MNKEEFKSLFLKLTEYTIPFGKEGSLEHLLPRGYQKDSSGNYFYHIGNSKTLFTCHLDTYSDKYEKVNHVIDPNDPYKIKTDGTTILGGDNKLGCSILIGMINKGIPGTYYFFLGEEPILSGGCWGSKSALKENTEYFKRFQRCIAFDRRMYGSIVVRQMGRMCCSPTFAQKIAEEFDIRGINWDSEGGFGYYTDTAVFMDVIPECTNISAGGFDEHHKTEWVDLNYTYEVYKAAIDMNWEKLPTVRVIEERFFDDGVPNLSYKNFKQKKYYDNIRGIFKLLGMKETRNIKRGENIHLTYSKWLEDLDFDIHLEGDKIKFGDNYISYSELINKIREFFKEDIIDELEYYEELIGKVENAKTNYDLICKIFNITDPIKFKNDN